VPLRCCILLLYKARERWAQDFEFIYLNWGGAKGIRTPDLLHAISRQHVHRCLSSQVTVPERAHRSGQVRTGCCTFALYQSARPTRPPNERLTSQNLQELYRGASRGSQHPIVLHEIAMCLRQPGLGRDHRLPRCRPARDLNYLPPQGPGVTGAGDPGLRLNVRICRIAALSERMFIRWLACSPASWRADRRPRRSAVSTVVRNQGTPSAEYAVANQGGATIAVIAQMKPLCAVSWAQTGGPPDAVEGSGGPPVPVLVSA